MKTKQQNFRGKADTEWSLQVRAGGKCEKCGATEHLHAHHVINKSLSSFLRYELKNGICLCFKCHFWWHHEAPTVTSDWFIKKFGQERFDWLNSQRHEPAHTNTRFYEENYIRLKELDGN